MSKPEATIRVGSVSGSVFLNEGTQGRRYLTATINRSYRNEENEWRTSDSYGLSQLLQLREVVTDSISYLKAHQGNDQEEGTE